jgi:hypothetical protein
LSSPFDCSGRDQNVAAAFEHKSRLRRGRRRKNLNKVIALMLAAHTRADDAPPLWERCTTPARKTLAAPVKG